MATEEGHESRWPRGKLLVSCKSFLTWTHSKASEDSDGGNQDGEQLVRDTDENNIPLIDEDGEDSPAATETEAETK